MKRMTEHAIGGMETKAELEFMSLSKLGVPRRYLKRQSVREVFANYSGLARELVEAVGNRGETTMAAGTARDCPF